MAGWLLRQLDHICLIMWHTETWSVFTVSGLFQQIGHICLYSILWSDFIWYTGMWSPKWDQSGQWISISMTSQWSLIMTSQWAMMLLGMHIIKSQWVMTLLGTAIVISQWVMMLLYIYHGITMHNDIAINLFYYVFSALWLIMILLWVVYKNKNKFMFD